MSKFKIYICPNAILAKATSTIVLANKETEIN